MLEGGPIDVLTGEYLAELTMLILWKSRLKDPEAGYATTFLRQMEEVAGLAIDRGVKIVVNAGGLNPAGLATRLRELLTRLGLEASVAHIEGDDLLPRLGELQAAGNELRHLDTGRSLPKPESNRCRRTSTSEHGALSKPSMRERISSSARASPTRRSSSAPRPGGSAGLETTGTGSPARWSPDTSSSAALRRPEATTASSLRCLASRISAFRSRRCAKTAARSSPSIRAVGDWS